MVLECTGVLPFIWRLATPHLPNPGVMQHQLHISEISNERVEKVSDVLKVGDMVDVKLLDVDFDKKRISLSMKALLKEQSEEE